jgi:hypothetical protein
MSINGRDGGRLALGSGGKKGPIGVEVGDELKWIVETERDKSYITMILRTASRAERLLQIGIVQRPPILEYQHGIWSSDESGSISVKPSLPRRH